MVTYAAPELPDSIDPPSPSPLNAFTVKPTRCPAALVGTASTALHDDPEQALSAGSLPTMPDWLVATSYDWRSGSEPLLQVTTIFSVPCRTAATVSGAGAGRLRLEG